MLRTGPQGLKPAFLWLWVARLSRALPGADY